MLLRDLLIATKDGDWGEDAPRAGFVPYRVIRGADFPEVKVGEVRSVPIRFLDSGTVTRRVLQPSDIIIETAGGNRDRPTGRTLLVTQRLINSFDLPATCASFCRFLRVDPSKADPRFVYWFLQHLYVQGQMWEHQVQHTGVARFQYTRFAETTDVPLLPAKEQKEIAEILGTLDDKIELNRRMNETLEAMVRAIFKSWFVDFDPVRAKAEGRQPFGMDAEAAALFPGSFLDSPLGKIPKGWRVGVLGEHVDAIRGLSYTGAGLAEVGFPLHNLNSVREGGGYKYEGLKHYIGEYEERHIVRPGDLIVTNTEQGFDFLLIGYPAIIPRCYGERGLFSHHLYRVRPKQSSPIKLHFLYLLLMSPAVRAQIVGCTNGTTVNMLAPDGLERPQFVLPPDRLIAAFEGIAEPIHARTETNREESETLTQIRDVLLPKLISGEIRVKDSSRVCSCQIGSEGGANEAN